MLRPLQWRHLRPSNLRLLPPRPVDRLAQATTNSGDWLQKNSRRAFALCGPRRASQNWLLAEWPRPGLLQTCIEPVGVRVQIAFPRMEQM